MPIRGALKMHDLKMTDKKTRGLENERLEMTDKYYGVWKMQDKCVGCTRVGKIDSCS